MIGVPPLAGFYGKFSVFLAGIKSSLYILAIIGVASSVISSAYYIRMIKLMYIDKCPKVLWYSPLHRETTLPLGVCVSFIILFMMYPVPLYLLMDKVSLLI
jgi:NADH-quinone oxidoreductase subunit N